jgi:hypothetical protein
MLFIVLKLVVDRHSIIVYPFSGPFFLATAILEEVKIQVKKL